MPGEKKSGKGGNAPQLNDQIAAQMLNNVFDACRFERNTVPLEVLTSYSNYRRERYRLQQAILIVVMVLFLLLPILFIKPAVTLTAAQGQTVDAVVSTVLPVKRIYATINGRNVPIYETASHQYVIQPSDNGEMTVTVTLLNGQTTTAIYEVSTVDTAAPQVLNMEMKDGLVRLYLFDEGSGINTDGILLEDADGNTVTPESYDAATGCLSVNYPDVVTHVYVPDNAGNELHLLLTPTT